jgi:hypothetical protein
MENILLAVPEIHPGPALGCRVNSSERGGTRQDTVSCYTYRNTINKATDRLDHPSKEHTLWPTYHADPMPFSLL